MNQYVKQFKNKRAQEVGILQKIRLLRSTRAATWHANLAHVATWRGVILLSDSVGAGSSGPQASGRGPLTARPLGGEP